MTTPPDDSPSSDVYNAPANAPAAQANQNREPNPRIVALPAHLREIPSCNGIPDLFTTYCLNIGLMLLFSVAFAGMLCLPFYDPSFFRAGIIMAVLWLILLGLIAWMVVIFIRGIRRPGVWFQVDPVGFRYGNGKSPDPAQPTEKRIEWSEVVANHSLSCDVTYNAPSKVTMSAANFEFWRRVVRKPAERYVLPKSLTDYDSEKDGIRCVRFKNRHALMVAILCGLAHQGLRFDLDTFIASGIHPETWQRLKSPWRSAAVYFFVVSLLGLFAFRLWGRSSLPFSFAILSVSFVFYCTEGKYYFSPDLKKYPKSPIMFRVDNVEAVNNAPASTSEGRS
ncbi:hypothetical protein [Paraburkholderia dilworthii]|uniref:Uncharacterized protein n=1 Tax=Paraburkholderia dilworthii TaxID=948106 RepID=A0ABW9D0R4_9BURK